ncbi:MAG: group II intron reverse transcriptase/maturase [Candidatus Omnitrophica bacterium]|nr:group II intron reverse transcriptase/maturase [Candidatus Omnitrophota bacterium]
MKAWKHAGGKGQTEKRRSERDTFPVHRDGIGKSTKLSLLNQRAARNKKEKFTSLMHLITEKLLAECYGELRKTSSPGIDGKTVKEYGKELEKNIKDLAERLKKKSYQPQPVKRVYIPKGNGKVRPLGIPAVEDKIVQMSIKKIIEPIFEPIFLPVSYGFRPGKGCHAALKSLNEILTWKEVNCVVDMDIAKFFDTVNHKWLMKFLKERIADPNMLNLIGRFLRTGVMEDGKVIRIEKGTPQGGVLSPLLANIYLHYVLDIWFSKIVKKHINGYAEMVRYADDVVECFESEEEAERFVKSLTKRVEKFGLKLSKEKTKIVKFGRQAWKNRQVTGKKAGTFNFLGFTHYCGTSRKGNYKVGRKTEGKRFNVKMKELNEWLKRARNMATRAEIWRTLSAKLRGHYQYYGVSENGNQINKYYKNAVKLAYKWLNRRSQKRSYNWSRFNRLLEYNPLPQPRICHKFYQLKPSS